VQIPAVSAAPDHGLLTLEHRAGLYIGRQVEVTLLVLFFGYGDGFPDHGDRIESFTTGNGCKSGVHLGVFVMFSRSGGVQIFQGGANHTSRESPDDFDFTAFQELEKPFGVLLFLIGGLFKDVGDLNQPILAGLAGKIGIAVTCLGFSGK
jgi:hypothetical protein